MSVKGATPIKRHVVERHVPPSPFDLNLIPRTKSISVIEKVYKNFVAEDSSAPNRIWFNHDDPWPLTLTGQQLWKAFVGEVPITTEIVDAIIRLLQEEDPLMYKDCGCDERQCGTYYHLASQILC